MSVDIVTLQDGTRTLTADAAAEHAGVERPTVYSWIRRYQIERVGRLEDGRHLYRLADINKAERATRGRARRNVGLRTVATETIADEDAVVVRLDCGHLKILSVAHAPERQRPVGCFECSAQRTINHIVLGSMPAAA